MIFELKRWPLHHALAWVLTRDRSYMEKVSPTDFRPRLSDTDWKSTDQVDQAWNVLYGHLVAGEVPAFTDNAIRLYPIDLEGCGWKTIGSNTTLVWGGLPIAAQIEISSTGLLHYFPPGSEPIAFGTNQIGPPESVIGGGYMAFANAVYWIATEGGRKRFWASECAIWNDAIKHLVNAITSGDVELIGRTSRDDLPSAISGFVLSGLEFVAPYSEMQFELIVGGQPYLDVTGPMSDSDWNDWNDCIRTAKCVKYSHLQVARADVARKWPPANEQLALAKTITPTRAAKHASADRTRKAVRALIEKKPGAGTRDADQLAKSLGASRDAVRAELQAAQSRRGLDVRLGRPRKNSTTSKK
jgi:hypothetical protein